MTTAEQCKKRRLLAKRDKLRSTMCLGCRHNYYNWPKSQSAQGDVAVAEDYCCWFLGSVHDNFCSQQDNKRDNEAWMKKYRKWCQKIEAERQKDKWHYGDA